MLHYPIFGQHIALRTWSGRTTPQHSIGIVNSVCKILEHMAGWSQVYKAVPSQVFRSKVQRRAPSPRAAADPHLTWARVDDKALFASTILLMKPREGRTVFWSPCGLSRAHPIERPARALPIFRQCVALADLRTWQRKQHANDCLVLAFPADVNDGR